MIVNFEDYNSLEWPIICYLGIYCFKLGNSNLIDLHPRILNVLKITGNDGLSLFNVLYSVVLLRPPFLASLPMPPLCINKTS